MTRGLAVIVALVVAAGPGLGCAARSARPASATTNDWAVVAALPPGSLVELSLVMHRVRGRLLSVDDGAVRIEQRKTPVELPRREILKLRLADETRADSRVNGSLWGLAAGVTYIAFVLRLLSQTGDSPSDSGAVVMVATAGGVGAGLGALVDHVIKRPQWRTVYQARR